MTGGLDPLRPVGGTGHIEKPKKKIKKTKSVPAGLRPRSNSSPSADNKDIRKDVKVVLNPLSPRFDANPLLKNGEGAPLSPRKRAGENAKVSFVDVMDSKHPHKLRPHDTPPPWLEDTLDKLKRAEKKGEEPDFALSPKTSPKTSADPSKKEEVEGEENFIYYPATKLSRTQVKNLSELVQKCTNFTREQAFASALKKFVFEELYKQIFVENYKKLLRTWKTLDCTAIEEASQAIFKSLLQKNILLAEAQSNLKVFREALDEKKYPIPPELEKLIEASDHLEFISILKKLSPTATYTPQIKHILGLNVIRKN